MKKKLMGVALGLSLLTGTVATSFAMQDQPKDEGKKKKKKKKKEGDKNLFAF